MFDAFFKEQCYKILPTLLMKVTSAHVSTCTARFNKAYAKTSTLPYSAVIS